MVLGMIDAVFDGILGHARVLAVLSRALTHPAPAYLFFGRQGIGKSLIAERFAKKLLGMPTHGVLDAHPDFIRLLREQDKQDISVRQARALVERMALSSASGGYRVALIMEAERLSEAACNALLKSVEDPSPRTVYFFVTHQPDRLPATLRSRLASIPCEPIPLAEQTDHMKAHVVLSADEQRENADLLRILLTPPIGKACEALERLTKAMENSADPEQAWREKLERVMQGLRPYLFQDPKNALRIGLGLADAWRLAGSAVSPRLALEAAALKPYTQEDFSLL